MKIGHPADKPLPAATAGTGAPAAADAAKTSAAAHGQAAPTVDASATVALSSTAVVLTLYPACAWFADVKRRSTAAWMSYL